MKLTFIEISRRVQRRTPGLAFRAELIVLVVRIAACPAEHWVVTTNDNQRNMNEAAYDLSL